MNKSKAFLDTKLFKRLLSYVLVYKVVFIFVAISAVLISIFSTITPYLIKIAVMITWQFQILKILFLLFL